MERNADKTDRLPEMEQKEEDEMEDEMEAVVEEMEVGEGGMEEEDEM